MSNCGLSDGVVHQHVERCYQAGLKEGRESLESLGKMYFCTTCSFVEYVEDVEDSDTGTCLACGCKSSEHIYVMLVKVPDESSSDL